MKTIIMATCLTSTIVVLGLSQANASNSKPYFPTSPWQSHYSITKNKTSPVYRQEWQRSKYRSCPILAIPTKSAVHLKTARSRAANFSDGWGVAYDVAKYSNGKRLRSAYGVANAGKTKLSDIYAWPDQRTHADGSFVTWGREGNNPNGQFLAYIVLDNGCFYNVWSKVSNTHLQNMIGALRYVK